MREILFRGKTLKGKWIEEMIFRAINFNLEVYTAISPILSHGDDFFYSLPDRENVIPETIGQYTGLTDKNGKKIFEGDIVKFEHPDVGSYKGVIYWSKEDMGFVFGILEMGILKSALSYSDAKGGMIDKAYEKVLLCSECYEVIGNIHDNPELLEVK